MKPETQTVSAGADSLHPLVTRLVDRFLSWPLPESVASDQCACEKGHPHRSGTNLLTATEAEAMIRHLLSLDDSPTWPHVLKFALRMEAKLAKNRHKGDREGWIKYHPWDLVERVLDETVELQVSFNHSGEEPVSPDPEKTANECADVANFCMMVADRVTDAKSGNS